MGQGTTWRGLDDIALEAFVSGELTLVAYTNTAGSLGLYTVAADLTQPAVSNGYAPIVLNGTWLSVNGIVNYDHPGKPGWLASGAWSATVTGVALVKGVIVRAYFDLAIPFIAGLNSKLEADLLALFSVDSIDWTASSIDWTADTTLVTADRQ